MKPANDNGTGDFVIEGGWLKTRSGDAVSSGAIVSAVKSGVTGRYLGMTTQSYAIFLWDDGELEEYPPHSLPPMTYEIPV